MTKIDDTRVITPKQADAALASMLINHDSHPDLMTIAFTLVADNRRSFSIEQVREVCYREMGVEFDESGRLVL